MVFVHNIIIRNKIDNIVSTYFGGLDINDGSMCNGAGGLYGPNPPLVNGATRAM